MGSLDSAETTRLAAADSGARYAPPGWMFWIRGGALVAQRLDLEQRSLAGDPVTIADPVGFDVGNNAGAFSVSSAGFVAYRSGAATRRQLQWFDRAGKMLGAFGATDEASLASPRLSPDGRRVAAFRTVQGNTDIWLLDGTRASRFTFDAALDRFPVWSPDGTRIVFDSLRAGSRNLYVASVDSPGSEALLLESSDEKSPNDWSEDGRFIVYRSLEMQGSPRGRDLWVMPLDGNRTPWQWLQTDFDERQGEFSPDGNWIAYQSNQSGRLEIYVRRFVPSPVAAGTGQWQISTGGGMYPMWRLDGKELFYIGLDGQMMAASVKATSTSIEAAPPQMLFKTRILGGGNDNNQGRNYDVTRDGRFLVNTVLDDAAAPITLLQNWSPPGR